MTSELCELHSPVCRVCECVRNFTFLYAEMSSEGVIALNVEWTANGTEKVAMEQKRWQWNRKVNVTPRVYCTCLFHSQEWTRKPSHGISIKWLEQKLDNGTEKLMQHREYIAFVCFTAKNGPETSISRMSVKWIDQKYGSGPVPRPI